MSKVRVLVIEDDADIRQLVQYNLQREGFEVLVAADGESGLREAALRKPSLILLDLMLPDLQGLEVCRLLRSNSETRSTPVIILTAKGEESDIVVGLELGADDYVTKPFSVKELMARARAVLRRASKPQADRGDEVVRLGRVEVDPVRHQVSIDGRVIPLTLAEFRLLRALASHPGQVMTRDQLLDHITGGKSVIIDRNVDVHIRSIRRKLGQAGRLIVTVRGVGYKSDAGEGLPN